MDGRHAAARCKVTTADANGANCQGVCVTLRSQSGDLASSGRSGLAATCLHVWLAWLASGTLGGLVASIVLQSPARSSACKSDIDAAVQRRLLLLLYTTTTTTTTQNETTVYN